MKNGTLNRLVHISEIGCVNMTPFNLNINGNIKTNGIMNKPCLQQDSIDAISDLLVV